MLGSEFLAGREFVLALRYLRSRLRKRLSGLTLFGEEAQVMQFPIDPDGSPPLAFCLVQRYTFVLGSRPARGALRFSL